ncbi:MULTISPECIES: hypothetical protein [Paenibacillus]|uniref:hypothetical protein n=1 Tax=Paenibacillus TaxID=44249 RepID=UPI0011AAD717|nr:hypothetical protein [Paenibacillus sp. IHBB 10380]
MLPDPERKLHRILVNFPGPQNRHQMPGLKLLEIKTGRRKQEIIEGLQYLEDQGYILWPDKSTTEGIKVIVYDVVEKTQPKHKQSNTAYWTSY